MKMEFVNLKAQYQAYKTEIDAAIQETLTSCHFIMGEAVSQVEKELAAFVGVEHAIACANGTDALLLALKAIGINVGDEVLVPAFSFIASASVIALANAKPVFCDVDERTYNIDPKEIEKKITSKTKAIIAVGLYGQPADMEAINTIAKKYSEKFSYKIYVIEDAAQNFGAEYQGKKSCNLCDIGCTSFFPAKPLGCYGDGGAIFTNNGELAQKLKILRVHGQDKRYHHAVVGMNSRLDTIQAAILRVKLKHFPDEIKNRERIAAIYSSVLKKTKIITPCIAENRTSVFAQYSIRVKNRAAVIEKLKEQGIPTAIHYPIPLHLQPCFAYLGYQKGDFSIAEILSEEIMSLPICAFLTESDQKFILERLLDSGK